MSESRSVIVSGNPRCLCGRNGENALGQAGAGEDRGNLGDRMCGARIGLQEEGVTTGQGLREGAEIEDRTAPVDRAHDEATFRVATLLGPAALQLDPHSAHPARKARSFFEPDDRR